jgi:hypothetical protein
MNILEICSLYRWNIRALVLSVRSAYVLGNNLAKNW